MASETHVEFFVKSNSIRFIQDRATAPAVSSDYIHGVRSITIVTGATGRKTEQHRGSAPWLARLEVLDVQWPRQRDRSYSRSSRRPGHNNRWARKSTTHRHLKVDTLVSSFIGNDRPREHGFNVVVVVVAKTQGVKQTKDIILCL